MNLADSHAPACAYIYICTLSHTYTYTDLTLGPL